MDPADGLLVARISEDRFTGRVFVLENGHSHKRLFTAADQTGWLPGVFESIPEAIITLRAVNGLSYE